MANSTPNYGYNSDQPAIHGIDADLRRVENKADANGQLAVQVAVNKSDIAHLDKRMDKLECSPCNTYCKEAIDCKLDSKASKCEFDKHLTHCDAHKKLFNQKVDKKDGCRLICEDELRQIRDDIDDRYTKGETYPREKLYTQGEVDDLLANKANIGKLILYNLEGGNSSVLSTTITGYFGIDSFGRVDLSVHGQTKDGSAIADQTLFGILPEEFRPTTRRIGQAVLLSNISGSAVGLIFVEPDGRVIMRTLQPSMESQNPLDALVAHMVFRA